LSHEQIRAARIAPLVPLPQKRGLGLQLIERPADNFELAAYKGLLLKVKRSPPFLPHNLRL
jgi:hypothetical protein